MSLNKKNHYALDELGIIPNHIAVIMDGNGRWAKKRFMPRVYGHKEGMNTIKKIAIHANALGVKVLTLYAFSTENWKRPNDEVSYLMSLPIDFFAVFMPEIKKNDIKITTMGWVNELPEKTQHAVKDAVEQTKDNKGMILNFAFNYGSRQEILAMVQDTAKKVEEGQLSAGGVTEDYVNDALFTGFLAPYQDPELVIRTSGEIRVSNFLL